MRYASAFLALSFAALAVLVAAGAFTGLDQWSVNHIMPGASAQTNEGGILEALIPLYKTHWHNAYSVAANIVTLPASFLIALGLTAWRDRMLAVMLLAGTAVETLCKEVLTRPSLDIGPWPAPGFDASFPSGHTLRTVLLAAAFLSPWSAAWAVASIVLLQLAGWHTPTDIAGGVILGLLALLCARGLRGRRLARSRPARG